MNTKFSFFTDPFNCKCLIFCVNSFLIIKDVKFFIHNSLVIWVYAQIYIQ